MTSQLALLVASDSASVFGGIIGFILWIAVMVWVYNLAKRKGRHPILWTILAFFFWLLASSYCSCCRASARPPPTERAGTCARRAGCAALRLGQRTVACSAPMSVTAKTAAYRPCSTTGAASRSGRRCPGAQRQLEPSSSSRSAPRRARSRNRPSQWCACRVLGLQVLGHAGSFSSNSARAASKSRSAVHRPRVRRNGEKPEPEPPTVGSTRARRAGSRRRGTTRWCPNPEAVELVARNSASTTGATASSLTKTALPSAS